MARGEIDIEPLGEVELWNRPSAGELPRWVRAVIAVACAITVAVVATSADVVWHMGWSELYYRYDAAWFRYAPPMAVAGILVLAFSPGASTSRWVRMAIVLPLVHVLAIVCAYKLLPSLPIRSLAERTPMVRALPVFPMLLLVAAATATLGALIARRARERVQAIVVLALANLLVLALWAPIACYLAAGTGILASWEAAIELLDAPAPFALLIVAPPFAIASTFTALVMHRPEAALRFRAWIVLGVVALFGGAVVARLEAYPGAFFLYDNAIHLILVTAMVAIVATGVLAVSTWRSARAASRRLARETTRSGVIADDGAPIVACLQITSWLRGPRLVARPFTVVSPAGEHPIPMGATIATPLPRITTALRTGEAVVILRQGDEVEFGGFVSCNAGDSPFRSAEAELPGPQGIVVGRAGEPASTAAEVGLAAWRPSVAYLVITIVAAIPGLLGLVNASWR